MSDDDPRLPTEADVARWWGGFPNWQSEPTSVQRAVLSVAREAARHALAQAPSLTNAEKRTVFIEGCLFGRESVGISWDYEAKRRYPDPVPAPVEYALGAQDYRIRDGILERLFPHGWQVVGWQEAKALKALAEGLA